MLGLKTKNGLKVKCPDLVSVIREIEKKKFSVTTSVITITEVLPVSSGPQVVMNFKKLFQRSNFQMINVDERVASKASEIRNHYVKEAKEKTIPWVC